MPHCCAVGTITDHQRFAAPLAVETPFLCPIRANLNRILLRAAAVRLRFHSSCNRTPCLPVTCVIDPFLGADAGPLDGIADALHSGKIWPAWPAFRTYPASKKTAREAGLILAFGPHGLPTAYGGHPLLPVCCGSRAYSPMWQLGCGVRGCDGG